MTNFARRALHKLKYAALDNLEVLTGQRDPLTPPKRLQFVGGGDYAAIGKEFFDSFVTLGGLEPGDKVLDVGSGLGRMAAPLTRYLTSGSYDGLDIDRTGIEWAHRHIHKRFANFRFHHADIHNSMYNPQGRKLARDYSFPFPDATYDFVLLTSVFTHMLEDDVIHYLEEIRRVMKPGATGLLTFFLLNTESLGLVAAGRSELPFASYGRHMYVTKPEVPEAAVAYDENWIRNELASQGLAIRAGVHYGRWSGRRDGLSFQDIVIIERAAE